MRPHLEHRNIIGSVQKIQRDRSNFTRKTREQEKDSCILIKQGLMKSFGTNEEILEDWNPIGKFSKPFRTKNLVVLQWNDLFHRNFGDILSRS